MECLYVGSEEAAENLEWIKEEGISCVLNATHDSPNFHEEGVDFFFFFSVFERFVFKYRYA